MSAGNRNAAPNGTAVNELHYTHKDTKTSSINPQFEDLNLLSKPVLDKHIGELAAPVGGFPVDALPEDIREIVYQTNECLGFPVDFIASSLLHAAGTAIGNTHKARYKWDETAVLFMSMVGNPGTVKSHPPEWAYAPISERDSAYYSTYREEFKEYEYKSATWNKKDGEDPPTKPVLKKHIVSDCTIEALVSVIDSNKRGVCSFNDEQAGWINDMNRYSGGSGDLQKWLSIWNSKAIVVDRKSSRSVRIEKPFISVIGTIQPAVIDELGKDNKNKNGFTDRMLFVWPKGIKRQRWTNKELPPHIKSHWYAIANKLLSLDFAQDQEGQEVSNYLRFDPDAEAMVMEWQDANIQKDEIYGSETIDGISAKIEVYALRFSLILQLLRWACGDAGKLSIDNVSVASAIKIAEYFKISAIEVAGCMNNRNPVDKLPDLKKNIYKALPAEFKTAEGAKVAEGMGMVRRTFEYWISNDRSMFKTLKHGNHEKLHKD